MDQNTERRHYLNSPVSARFVRVRPLTWHKRIGMRAAVIGCPHRGDCGVGFFRVNSGSACGESDSEWAGEGDRAEKSVSPAEMRMFASAVTFTSASGENYRGPSCF